MLARAIAVQQQHTPTSSVVPLDRSTRETIIRKILRKDGNFSMFDKCITDAGDVNYNADEDFKIGEYMPLCECLSLALFGAVEQSPNVRACLDDLTRQQHWWKDNILIVFASCFNVNVFLFVNNEYPPRKISPLIAGDCQKEAVGGLFLSYDARTDLYSTVKSFDFSFVQLSDTSVAILSDKTGKHRVMIDRAPKSLCAATECYDCVPTNLSIHQLQTLESFCLSRRFAHDPDGDLFLLAKQYRLTDLENGIRSYICDKLTLEQRLSFIDRVGSYADDDLLKCVSRDIQRCSRYELQTISLVTNCELKNYIDDLIAFRNNCVLQHVARLADPHVFLKVSTCGLDAYLNGEWQFVPSNRRLRMVAHQLCKNSQTHLVVDDKLLYVGGNDRELCIMNLFVPCESAVRQTIPRRCVSDHVIICQSNIGNIYLVSGDYFLQIDNRSLTIHGGWTRIPSQNLTRASLTGTSFDLLMVNCDPDDIDIFEDDGDTEKLLIKTADTNEQCDFLPDKSAYFYSISHQCTEEQVIRGRTNEESLTKVTFSMPTEDFDDVPMNGHDNEQSYYEYCHDCEVFHDVFVIVRKAWFCKCLGTNKL